jgi:apolipoprotein N-acyltransferase
MRLYIAAIVAGITLGLAWIVSPLFAFVGFMPMLFLAQQTSFWQYARLCYVFFLSWNLVAASWIPQIDFEAGTVMMIVVPVLMSVPMLWSFQQKKPYLFAISWIAFEYLQYQWEFLWSWLTLGNCLANLPDAIQWYEFTGTLGGSAWIWVGNILIFQAIRQARASVRLTSIYLLGFASSFGVAFGVGAILALPTPNDKQDLQVLILQPNINPKTEKFKKLKPLEQAQILTRMIDSAITKQTDLVILPEAILGKRFEMSGLFHVGNYKEWDTLKNCFDKYPNTSFVFGMNMHRWVHGAERAHYTAHKENEHSYRKIYNVALLYQKWQPKKYHYKMKRVPSSEYTPLPNFMKPLIPEISLNITPASTPRLLENKTGLKIGTLICYESTYGEYVTNMTRLGAQILAIITEDGYWNGTAEPAQHFAIDRLRAIENRRVILRSSSMGYSCLIDRQGKAHYTTPENKRAVISLKTTIDRSPSHTFYSIWGDWIGFLACIVVLGFVGIRMKSYFLKKVVVR